MRIAFIGLGNMGAPIAKNLLDDGHALTVWNRDRARTAAFAASGATVADSVAHAARDAEFAITMLADDNAERAVSLGADGLVAHLPRDAVRMSMSTIGLAASRELAAAHAAAGQHYVAAPVFGRPPAAASRKLWIAAAGSSAARDRCKPVLEALSRGITWAGDDAPRAHALKLGANALGAVFIEGIAESLAFGEKAGVSRADFLSLLESAMFETNFAGLYARMIVSGADAPGGFPIRLGLKDNALAQAAADEIGAPLGLAALVRDRLRRAVAEGRGEQDLPRLADLAFEDAGLSPR